VTGVHVVTIRKVGNGFRVICGHVARRNGDERLPGRLRVQGMHRVGPEGSLDRGNGHVVHT
jgi:hypothetical protein